MKMQSLPLLNSLLKKPNNYNMIQVTTLQGRKFFRDAWGSTMTSRHTYNPEYWVVVEDKGATCMIAEIKDGKPTDGWHQEWSREQVEQQLKSHSCYRHVGEYEIQL